MRSTQKLSILGGDLSASLKKVETYTGQLLYREREFSRHRFVINRFIKFRIIDPISIDALQFNRGTQE